MTESTPASAWAELGFPVIDGVPLIGDRKLPPPGRLTWEEFLAWADEDSHAEWVDGKVLVWPPDTLDHQDIVAFVYWLLAAYVEARQLGEVYFKGLLMHLATRPSAREPGIVFIARQHQDRLRDTYLYGPADLVVEVISPDSDARDRSEKLLEYEAAGIPEYWLIDPIRREALFYRLGEDKRYHLVPIGPDGIYHSIVLPGFALRVEWLWRRPLPAVRDVVRQIGV